jgi:hypothetical protein
MPTNPFVYGRAVNPAEFYNYKREIRRIIGRMQRGESTAIVGQPHTGKTSLLNMVMERAVQREVLGAPLEQTILRYIDSHMLGQAFTQNEFWDHVLAPVTLHIQDENIQDLYAIAQENHFGAFTLEKLFTGLQNVGWKVVILLDEFEALLTHPVLNSTEFYGSLRSLASRFSSLALIIATRHLLDDLNVDTQKLNPHGSPYFNIFIEQRLGALPQNAAEELLKQAGSRFDKADLQFVLDVSGRHPFLLQLTAVLLWDYEPQTAGEGKMVRYEAVANELYEQTAAHFNDTWRTWSNAERKVVTAIALTQIPQLVEGHDFKWEALIDDLDDFSPELRGLEKDGTVVKTDYDETTGWAITQQALLWWLADLIKREVRDDKAWDQWLEAQEFGAVLTKQERERFDNAAKTVRTTIGRGAATLIESFIKGLTEGWAKAITG